MALGFSSGQRLERLLLKTRSILGEGEAQFLTDNKAQALQLAASLYGLYGGDGSETDYTDKAGLSVLQSELIATRAAIELLTSAISYYKDDVTEASGGPASASFRTDKLDWLRLQLEELKAKKEELEGSLEVIIDPAAGLPGLFLKKVRACADPVDDTCCDTSDCRDAHTAGCP